MMTRLAPLFVLVAACGEERVGVLPGDHSDYNHAALQTSVDAFVAHGRTAPAYGDLARAVLRLRPGMDRSVGEEAELKLIVLAFGPVNAMQGKPIAEQVEALALTVWPTLLAPPIAADEVVLKRDPKAAQLTPQLGEDPKSYLERLCGGPLASDCKHVVPEYQGAVISALAIHRATERVRNAVADCMMCGTEPAWHQSVRSWESLDVLANGTIHAIERQADPDNWPIAGSASEIGSALPDVTVIWREAEVNALGEIVIGGQPFAIGERIAALRDLRGDNDTITLHLRPELTLAQVKAVLADAKKSGANKVAIVARAPEYPWERRIYWLSTAGQVRAGLRPTDSLQLLLHTLDHIAGPGAVARVD